MIKKISFLFFILLIYLFSPLILFSYEKPEEITFATNHTKVNRGSFWLKAIYTEAFSRMGIKFNLIYLPGNRASTMAEAGLVDGELERVYSYQDIQNNLIRVKENSKVISFAAFSLDENINLGGWKSLKNYNYRVGYRLGTKLPEKMLPSLIKEENISATRDVYAAIAKLKMLRIDIYIDIEEFTERFKASEEFKNLDIKLHKVGIMQVVTAHAYLHKKHEALEPELSKTLYNMKKEGFFDKYKKEYNLNIKW